MKLDGKFYFAKELGTGLCIPLDTAIAEECAEGEFCINEITK
jgi:hypothetical protein